jgi:hypothetical protein
VAADVRFTPKSGHCAAIIAYYSVSFAHQRKIKQRSVTWLPLSVSIAVLAGFIWWLHYTVRIDLTLATAALTDAMPPAPMVAPAPVTPGAPVVNPNFACIRHGNIATCSIEK